MKRPIVIIDGTIGVGKTTLLHEVEKLPEMQIFWEPVIEWNAHVTPREEFNPLLNLYRMDHLSSVNFQLKVMDTLVTRYEEAMKLKEVVTPVFERSNRSCAVFVNARAKESDFAHEKTDSLISTLGTTLYRTMEMKHDVLYILLLATTDEIRDRMTKRARENEDYSYKYIHNVNAGYQMMAYNDPSIVCVNTNSLSAIEVATIVKDKIKNFLAPYRKQNVQKFLAEYKYDHGCPNPCTITPK